MLSKQGGSTSQSPGHITPLSALLDEVVSDLGISEKIVECNALLVWNNVVGPSIAQYAQPIRVKDGILEVAVPSAVWRTQLKFLAIDIVNRINHNIGSENIRELRLINRQHKKVQGEAT